MGVTEKREPPRQAQRVPYAARYPLGAEGGEHMGRVTYKGDVAVKPPIHNLLREAKPE